jgi:hypothetical protein
MGGGSAGMPTPRSAAWGASTPAGREHVDLVVRRRWLIRVVAGSLDALGAGLLQHTQDLSPVAGNQVMVPGLWVLGMVGSRDSGLANPRKRIYRR